MPFLLMMEFPDNSIELFFITMYAFCMAIFWPIHLDTVALGCLARLCYNLRQSHLYMIPPG